MLSLKNEELFFGNTEFSDFIIKGTITLNGEIRHYCYQLRSGKLWRIGINLQAAKTLLIQSIFYWMNSTIPIACWYMNPHFDQRLQTSFFWYDGCFIWTGANATVLVSRYGSLYWNFNSFIIQSVYSRFDSYIDWGIIKSLFQIIFFVFNIEFLLLIMKNSTFSTQKIVKNDCSLEIVTIMLRFFSLNFFLLTTHFMAKLIACSAF